MVHKRRPFFVNSPSPGKQNTAADAESRGVNWDAGSKLHSALLITSLISSLAAKDRHWLVCFQTQCSDGVFCFLQTRPTGACRRGFLAVLEKMFNFYLFTPVSIIAHVLQNVQQDGCAREVVSGATLANTGVVVVPHWPKRMWWWCHIGQHGCGGGATLTNTGVVVVPHWPTRVWWWCHIDQHRCGGGATLAKTDVVVVPHWPTRVWWRYHIGQHGCGGGATLANTGVVASGNKLVDAGSCATCASEGPAVAGTTHALKAPSMMTSAFCSRLFQ